ALVRQRQAARPDLLPQLLPAGVAQVERLLARQPLRQQAAGVRAAAHGQRLLGQRHMGAVERLQAGAEFLRRVLLPPPPLPPPPPPCRGPAPAPPRPPSLWWRPPAPSSLPPPPAPCAGRPPPPRSPRSPLLPLPWLPPAPAPAAPGRATLRVARAGPGTPPPP